MHTQPRDASAEENRGGEGEEVEPSARSNWKHTRPPTSGRLFLETRVPTSAMLLYSLSIKNTTCHLIPSVYIYICSHSRRIGWRRGGKGCAFFDPTFDEGNFVIARDKDWLILFDKFLSKFFLTSKIDKTNFSYCSNDFARGENRGKNWKDAV